MNRGRIEQIGSPRDVYERPASEFVMKFIGPVNQVGDTFIRPHDIDIRAEPTADSIEAMIDRITHIGFEVRVHVMLGDGRALWAQVTRDDAEQLELSRGQIVHIRPSRTMAFPQAI
jgi:sulfate transport system ATP-binding protein